MERTYEIQVWLMEGPKWKKREVYAILVIERSMGDM